MNLTMNDSEKELIITLLHRHIVESRVGQRHSFSREYRDGLVKEENLAEELIDRLKKAS